MKNENPDQVETGWSEVISGQNSMEHSDWLKNHLTLLLGLENVLTQSERSLKLSNKNRLGESKTSIWDQNID